MESLPPIHEMYSTIREKSDDGVIRRYQNHKPSKIIPKPITKKGSYIEDHLRNQCSPGPANKANLLKDWTKLKNKVPPKHSERKTDVEWIQHHSLKKNFPAPSQYRLTFHWPERKGMAPLKTDKINFLFHSEYESDKTPGPGTYMVATKIAKRVQEYKYVENKPRSTNKQILADMNTYDPIPSNYDTFQKLAKMPKQLKRGEIKVEARKPEKQNRSPGPGQYQMIHSWKGKDKLPKGSLSYLDRISRRTSPSLYYS